MKKGDRVRVKESVIVYHNPKQRREPFDIKGMEGEVLDIMEDWQGRPISPNLPVVVEFEPKFKAHLREDELEVI
ncbi:ferredoxin-thioredoxin reductase variable chain [Myxosarcina sp. GI1]|uniref:ferredoxin-thioredoxin reductase variable chain n=1 Tax=Myxosarcina sp. GI1 TaxID=1541065 RepID=UPI000568E7AA|nr:ferredoxin-thioredoxin reductase variable chain [Myxosarcina sp. GI1]